MEINVGGRGGGKSAYLKAEEHESKIGRPSKANDMPHYLACYIERKIKMLKNEFHLKLTEEEIARFWSLPGDDQVDRYAHKLIQKYL